MKKIILTLFVVGLAFNANAQFGVRGGAHFSSAKIEISGSSDNTDSATGFYVGAFFNINLGKLGIRPELNYVMVEDFDQFQIPVLLQLGLGEKLSVVAGPNFGFRTDNVGDEESFNLGIDMGLAFAISEKFSVEARYNLGTTDMFENISGVSATMNGFQVGGAFKF